MDEESDRRVGETLDNPSLAHRVVLLNEAFIDNLKILSYENKFCEPHQFLPFPRHYFALSSNPGEQFHAFSSLTTWLLGICGQSIDMPQEYDDPNSTLAAIIEGLKKLSINVDFPPARLKSGYGEHVCYVISELSTLSLKKVNFSYKRPEIPKMKPQDDELVDEDDAEVQINKIEEDIVEDQDSDEEGFLHVNELTSGSVLNKESDKNFHTTKALSSTVRLDPSEWQLEVERVVPLLRVQVASDVKDWRSHLDQMTQYKNSISGILDTTKSKLDEMHQEIVKTLDKVSSREKYINSQLEGTLKDLRSIRERHSEVRQKFEVGTLAVNELTQELNRITDDLESVKIRMDEHGTNMTDSTPLVRIKRGLSRLKSENIEMDLRIGVLQHMLTLSKLKDKATIQNVLLANDTKI